MDWESVFGDDANLYTPTGEMLINFYKNPTVRTVMNPVGTALRGIGVPENFNIPNAARFSPAAAASLQMSGNPKVHMSDRSGLEEAISLATPAAIGKAGKLIDAVAGEYSKSVRFNPPSNEEILGAFQEYLVKKSSGRLKETATKASQRLKEVDEMSSNLPEVMGKNRPSIEEAILADRTGIGSNRTEELANLLGRKMDVDSLGTYLRELSKRQRKDVPEFSADIQGMFR